MNAEPLPICPVHASRDERKSARMAAERVRAEPGARVTGDFLFGREILRSAAMRQAGVGAEQIPMDDPDRLPVFYLDGEPHKRKRVAIARFFTPRAINGRYREVMEQTTDALLARMRADGQARLDRISFQLAVAVAAEIVGLTNSNQITMAGRIRSTLSSGVPRRSNLLTRLLASAAKRYCALRFFFRDVRPAIKARRKTRREDVISHLLDEGYSQQAILIECMTYAVAGMVTTREFIVMAAWHLLERDDLRARFRGGGEEDQIAMLEEILRLEPVAAMLHRRAAEDMASRGGETVTAGALLAVDIRAVNTDEAVTGPCPYRIDPDRAKRMKMTGSYLSFGDGSHRCPGSQVALHETRIFLDRLLRLPGIRLAREPDMQWCEEVMSYELRDAIVSCEKA